MDRDSVALKVQPPGSVCLEAQEQTIVLSRGLPQAVRARIIGFDLVTGELRLGDLSYVDSHFGERMIARVQPEETIQVELHLNGDRQVGKLVDVSLSGIGVFVDDPIFERGQEIQVTLNLREGPVSLPGRVLNITHTPENPSRLSIGFTRNAQEIAVVMRYIKERRTEILTEVERMYERSYQKKIAQMKDESV